MKKINRLIGLLFLVSPSLWPATQIFETQRIDAQADLTNLTPVSTSLDIANTYLVKWRGANPTQSVNTMTFEYFQNTSGNSTPYPTHSAVHDNTANDQGDLWSDNAIQVSFTKGNTAQSAILIYTNNQDQFQITGNAADKLDPLYNVPLRGGLVGGVGQGTTSPYRVSVLPLIWKNVTLKNLTDAASADVSGTALPNGSPLIMPTEITTTSGGTCVPDGTYAGGARTSAGFCDFSTHFTLDMNNNIEINPENQPNSWYQQYPNTSAICYGTTACSAARLNAFNYASLIGPYGINTGETGTGGLGNSSPAYVLLGVEMDAALLTHYGTTIYVEVLSR